MGRNHRFRIWRFKDHPKEGKIFKDQRREKFKKSSQRREKFQRPKKSQLQHITSQQEKTNKNLDTKSLCVIFNRICWQENMLLKYPSSLNSTLFHIQFYLFPLLLNFRKKKTNFSAEKVLSITKGRNILNWIHCLYFSISTFPFIFLSSCQIYWKYIPLYFYIYIYIYIYKWI